MSFAVGPPWRAICLGVILLASCGPPQERAWQELKHGNYSACSEILAHEAFADPDSALLAIRCHRAANDFEAALQTGLRAQKQFPSTLGLTSTVAEIYAELELHAEAVAVLEGLHRRQEGMPAQSATALTLAMQYISMEQWALADHWFATVPPKIVEAAGPEMLRAWAWSKIHLGQFQSANAALEGWRQIYPLDPWLVNTQGHAWYNLNEPAKARAYFAQAVGMAIPTPAPDPAGPLQLPLHGYLRVNQADDGPTHMGLENHYAWDFSCTDAAGDRYRGVGRELTDHFSYRCPVFAAATGQVWVAHDGANDNIPNLRSAQTPRGNHLLIAHPSGLVTEYFHLRSGSLRVHVGDVVRRGELIAEVGNSGDSDFPHLHFAATRDDIAVPVTFEPFWRVVLSGEVPCAPACDQVEVGHDRHTVRVPCAKGCIPKAEERIRWMR